MHNLSTVFWFEFVRTINKRSFWIGTLIVPALLTAIFGLSYFSERSASSAGTAAANERFSLAVLDDSGLVSPAALAALDVAAVDSREAGIESVRSGVRDAFFYYPASPSSEGIEVYGKDSGLVGNGKYTQAAETLLKSSVATEIASPEKIAIVQGSLSSKLTTFVDGKEAPGFARVLAPGFFLVLLYLIIVLLGNQMLTSTTEEKENRVIEMILTSVSARTLIIGKIFALVLAGIVQTLVVSLPAVVGLTFFKEQLRLPSFDLSALPLDPARIGIAAAVFVLSFLLFTGMLVAIGAAVPTAKEANQFFGVAILLMFVPLYAASALVVSPGQLIVRVFTLFPLTAPVTLLLRNAVGNLSPWETGLGIAILAVSSAIALSVAVRAFRYGTIEYSRKLSLRELFGR